MFNFIDVCCLIQAESLQAECDFTKEQVAAMKGKQNIGYISM